ncbi:interleukin-1 receptor type 2 isoform X2 [Talpa occidentalis]|nr:interleukin-1 receptor type 2 isoform X2 [Talpa occidentalis]XP_037384823.1 interleukin-1 receptor type 2 isoform X2 [Talpa occidentalis]XP_037384824.1 interleukin-1 receptor type 2 isoform X2 [Talpa occidentalis]XP_037384825.1 interleukin-1 receptor type 2 isoform X2 [Talpa occidentalis]XP_037384826.1 interleukin-1 receptor type 2 isoform X2 [Talpa occidentalis]
MSTSCVLWKLSETMFVLFTLVMGVSAFVLQPVEPRVTAGNCQFRGKHFKSYFKVEGEPVILRCPQVRSWSWASSSAHINLTWRKNDSTGLVPEEQTRVRVQDGALWMLPVLQGDSGTYICTVRNASYCDEMSIELKVFEKTEASLPFMSYPQILILASSGSLVCPELSEFTHDKTDTKLQWYKDSVPLDQDSEKFVSMRGNTRLIISNVSVEDAGYYTCVMKFAYEGKQYNVTRNIELRVNKRQEEKIPVIISPHQTILASLGSKLTIPCKVFLGTGTQSTTMLWWLANNTNIESTYQGGRVTEGPRQEYTENNENYIEVPLIFDPVIKEDLNMDFKCVVFNTLSFQTLRTTVKEAATFSWKIALAPLSLILLVLGGIWIHRRYKRKNRKSCALAMLKTVGQDFRSHSRNKKEMK